MATRERVRPETHNIVDIAWDPVTRIVGKGLLVFAIVVGVVVALFLAFRFLRDPENRGRIADEMQKRRALRPLTRRGLIFRGKASWHRPCRCVGRACAWSRFAASAAEKF